MIQNIQEKEIRILFLTDTHIGYDWPIKPRIHRRQVLRFRKDGYRIPAYYPGSIERFTSLIWFTNFITIWNLILENCDLFRISDLGFRI